MKYLIVVRTNKSTFEVVDDVDDEYSAEYLRHEYRQVYDKHGTVEIVEDYRV